MSFTKTYFLCPTSDFIQPPPTGPLCLGSIIRSTSAPQYPLNKATVVAVADSFPAVVETHWKKTISTEKGHGLGTFAQFLQLATFGLPLGPEVNVERLNTTANTFAFDTMTTLAFEPTQEYIEEAVRVPVVETWLREPRQKFALGAKIKYSSSQSTTVNGNLGVDVPTQGMTFGPKGHWTRTDDDATESSRESEFVFAFRVKRLKFGRRLKLEEYTKGAFMTVGGKKDDDECFLVEDVDRAAMQTAKAVSDVTENGNVYCVPA
ncbi:uncharacterized protein K460DRAFT_375055 [Cucurbitaria berberidis CBS 394.84]|uniref:Uncharacterized protein n=1 Tax=Cucurbitaria berberidis CBS 394.84 TaxID=1168544 RepID=A0A9P4GMG3_9PLEO|nr:uncharacterized protein K460DRAFT_375055 [Cucurbitaria berberidis CBS 394.84]KAF1848144.1 hypothetical protein K460DRAFT_375055 [Cucurbitaria berberidis CBS 394.84]